MHSGVLLLVPSTNVVGDTVILVDDGDTDWRHTVDVLLYICENSRQVFPTINGTI